MGGRMRNKASPEVLRLYREFKDNAECITCKEDHPATLEFHHRDPSTKFKAVGSMVREGFNWDKVKEEIEKCDVLCSNCHRKYHYSPPKQEF